MLTKIKDLFKKEESSEEKKSTSEKITEEIKTPENLNGEVKENITEKSASAETNSEEAISLNTDVEKTDQPSDDAPKHSLEEIKDEVIKVLKTCYDPEIPVDVWELGLIYEINAATNGDVLIVMTLTSPSCPVAEILPVEIEKKVKEHPMINDCKVQLTFDPPWSQRNMSEVAKLELGFL